MGRVVKTILLTSQTSLGADECWKKQIQLDFGLYQDNPAPRWKQELWWEARISVET
jgi:hypothetical protein